MQQQLRRWYNSEILNKKPCIRTAFFIPKKMKVLFLNTPLIFSLIPRIYPTENDNLVLNLRKETGSTILNPAFTFTVGQKLEITITTQPNQFKTLDKFEFELKRGEDILYLGKIQILKEGTSVQNFNYAEQNERFTYK
jgi:hypothetical protein